MSITIYTGMRSFCSIKQLIHELTEYRKSIKPCYTQERINKWPIDFYKRMVLGQESTIQLMPTTLDNYVFAVVLPQDSLNLAKGMSDQKLVEDISEHTSLKPYPYWDNSGTPEDVTEEEWSLRRELWERVMPGYKPIKYYGVTFFLSDFQSLTQ